MARFFLVLSLVPAAFAAQLPKDTVIPIRLTTRLATKTAKPGDTIRAAVIAPLAGVPAGTIVAGVIDKSSAAAPDQRATLSLQFDSLEIAGKPIKIAARVKAVDNARESVDGQGLIAGILASETLAGRMDAGIERVAQRYSGLAGVLGAVKNTVFQQTDTEITYEPGVEMELALTEPLELPDSTASEPPPCPDRNTLARIVAMEPFLTRTQKPDKPSDITNLMLVGSADTVRRAFQEAGWSQAAGLNAVAKFETFRAIAEQRGYNEAPVSVLQLDGKPPEMAFEKLNNTFEQRHHLRVWLTHSQFQGEPVWSVAATHDIGISFSQEDHTFIHRIDSQIDREREKVVNDLLFAGRVRSMDRFERPNVPRNGRNATGDEIVTDGRIAVLILK